MAKTKRVYLKPGDIIGCDGYIDLKIVKNKAIGQGYVLHSTEGGSLDFYEESTDSHHAVNTDMNGTPETNKNFGKFYYEYEQE
jgi:hypothetical protein